MRWSESYAGAFLDEIINECIKPEVKTDVPACHCDYHLAYRRNRKYRLETIENKNRQTIGPIKKQNGGALTKADREIRKDMDLREKWDGYYTASAIADPCFAKFWRKRVLESKRITKIQNPAEKEKEWKRFLIDIENGCYGNAITGQEIEAVGCEIKYA